MNSFTSFGTVILLLISFSCFADPFLRMDTLLTYPAAIHNQFGKKVEHVYLVDFSGDGLGDYVIELKTNHPDQYHEVWLTSHFEPYLQKVNQRMEFDYRFFINLDEDDEAELITARGSDKGINYVLLDYTGKREEIICYFNPVIETKGAYCFGYPWDLTGVDTKRIKKERCLKWTIVHELKREGTFFTPEKPKPFPLLYLEGRLNGVPVRPTERGKEEYFSLIALKGMRLRH